jgi:hypothetical protein
MIDGESENIVNALRIVIPRLVDRKSFELDSLYSSTDSENFEFVKWLIPESYHFDREKGTPVQNISTLTGAHVRVVPIHECKDYHPGERFEIVRS